jgi:hypothetical protein
MPHAFKANPDHPAVAYLVRLHADLGGRILENRKEAKRLAESMKHVEAVIRLFNPAYDTRRISVRRRYKGNPWFKRGTLLRHALDALRKAQGPLTAREITETHARRSRRVRCHAQGNARANSEPANIATKSRRQDGQPHRRGNTESVENIRLALEPRPFRVTPRNDLLSDQSNVMCQSGRI